MKEHSNIIKLNKIELEAVKKWIKQPGDQGKNVCVRTLKCSLCRRVFPGIEKCPCKTFEIEYVKKVAVALIEYNNAAF